MNRLQRFLAQRVLGVKSLYDLHPELLDRAPILREYSDQEAEHGDYRSAAEDYAYHVWTRKAANIVANNIAPLRLRVIREPEGDEVEGHPVTEALADPRSMSPNELWQRWALEMQLAGEFGLEVAKTRRGEIAELWPRRSNEVYVRVDKRKRRYGGVTGYRIKDDAGPPYDLPPDEFIWWAFYNPLNPYRGISLIQAVRMGILIDQYSQAWSRMFFKNAARPDLAIVTPQGLTATERAEILARFDADYGGLGNAWRPIVLEDGVTDVKPISHPPKDIEWLEQRRFNREEIGAIFGVPDEIMGWGKDTYENLKFSMVFLWRITLVPLIGMRDNVLGWWFRRQGMLGPGERLATDLSGIEALQEDKGAKVDQAVKLWQIGVPLNVLNDVLGLGLGDLRGGDVGYIPLGVLPATSAPVEAQPEGSEKPEAEEEAAPAPVLKAGSEVGAEPELAIPYGGTLHKALWALFKGKQAPREEAMVRLLRKAFQEQQDRINAKLRALDEKALRNAWALAQAGDANVVLKQTLADVWDDAAERETWAARFEEFVQETLRQGGEHGIEQVTILAPPLGGMGIAFDLANPLVVEALEEVLWSFTNEVSETTQAALLEAFQQGAAEGWTIPRLSDAISALYEGFKGHRSELIARTETTKGYNCGALEGYRQAAAAGGAVVKKGWLSALDDRTRTMATGADFDHVAAHGEEVALDAVFVKSGEPMRYPGDPKGSIGNLANCRCSVYPVIAVPEA